MTEPENSEELQRRRRTKNIVLLAVLFCFVAVIYVVSIVRMGGG